MDYIDWIISSVLFITVIAFVLISLFNILPKSSNTNTVSDLLYKSTISQIIPVYNISINSEDSEVYPYVISDINYGRAENTFAIDNNNNLLFGLIYDKDKFYNYDTNIDSNYGNGVLLLEENFNDFNYEDTFTLNFGSPEIKSGILVANSETQLKTTNEYYDYFGFLSSTSENLIVYINYTDINNYYYCKFSNADINLYSVSDGNESLIDSVFDNKITDWRRIYFGYNVSENTAYCKTDNQSLETTITGVSSSQIYFTLDDGTYIDDLYIYLNNDLKSNSVTKTINGNYLDVNISDNLTTINIIDEYFPTTLDFNVEENLIVPDINGISVIKNSNSEINFVFFPQAKEFWANLDSEGQIEITLDNNTGVNIDINNIEDQILWLDASELDLNDSTVVTTWPDLSPENNDAVEGSTESPPTYKENIINGFPVVRFNNNVLTTANSVSLDDWTIFAVFKDSGVDNYERLIDHDYVNGFWWGRNSSTANSWGGGVKEASPPHGRFITANDNEWHILKNIRDGTNHTLISETDSEVGTVTTNATTSKPLGIGCWYNAQASQRAINTDIAEILVYDSALSENNINLIDGYLGQKYAISTDTNISASGNQIKLIDLNTNNQKMAFYFYTKNTQMPINCNYEYQNKILKINDCEEDTTIKIVFNYNIDNLTEPEQEDDVNFYEIENQFLWLDASTLDLNDGDLVSIWPDLSGQNNNATQSNESYKPVYKENIVNELPVVRFNTKVLVTPAMSLDDWTIFVVFNDQSTITAYERILDHDFTNGFWWGRNSSSANSWGGGVKETANPYGRFVSATDGEWHIIKNKRDGTLHTITSETANNFGTVTTNATTSNPIGIGGYANQGTPAQWATNMDIAEILAYNRALTSSEETAVEEYLAEKYDIGNSGENPSTQINIETSFFNYPYINITKTNEKIVTQEHFENLSCDSYFVNIKNKTLDVNCGIGVNPNYKMIIKYLHNTGLLENADIYIK